MPIGIKGIILLIQETKPVVGAYPKMMIARFIDTHLGGQRRQVVDRDGEWRVQPV